MIKLWENCTFSHCHQISCLNICFFLNILWYCLHPFFLFIDSLGLGGGDGEQAGFKQQTSDTIKNINTTRLLFEPFTYEFY